MLDIAYITILYFLAGFFTAKLFDTYIVPKPNKKEESSVIYKISKVIYYVILTSIAMYIWRNIVQEIPSPFEGIVGLKHKQVHELIEAPILIFAIFFYQKHLDEHLREIYSLL